ncbi:hypothetical protein VF21_04366 [Pseudogymnoascus sp. 05NY08]|nr:hypothetical protein VF21_04366 [Pseudogymnoascus sp. 05NY08]
MASLLRIALWGLYALGSNALRYEPEYVGYNLNEDDPTLGAVNNKWAGHTYHPSPTNWRFPFYTLFLDKFVNGDPSNDNINGTLFEHDSMQTMLRHGGDIQGLIDSLDYIAGMGVKGLYIAGTPWLNFPWGADSYSPLDFTLLDQHYGNIAKYREMVDEIHRRGMYIIVDTTMSTMGDLHGFEGHLNDSAPFKPTEYKVVIRDKTRQYHDFHPQTEDKYNETCAYPTFWDDTGHQVGQDVLSQLGGCFDSEFDQAGDIPGVGFFPDWQNQLGKYQSVQDRLREWMPSVREKLENFACLTIQKLDIDGYRFDKGTQITLDALAEINLSIRECAREVGKDNFFIAGEISGGNTFGSLYLGRGRTPEAYGNITLDEAVKLNNASNATLFMRDEDHGAYDAAAFHYSVYRSLTRFLGMQGFDASFYDVPADWVETWNVLLRSNDLVNPNTNKLDPRHMYGTANQDVFRWPAIQDGVEKQLLGSFITTIHMPGIPLMYYGEEQGLYLLDNTADNYLFGRQAMSASVAWQAHGCYNLSSSQYSHFGDVNAQKGCEDDAVSLDHRDPSHPIRNIMKGMHQMRLNYPVLNDGLFLQALSNQTQQIPIGEETREVGIWSALRSGLPKIQDLSSAGGQGEQEVWLLYHNDNVTVNYAFNCAVDQLALVAPFPPGTVLRNLFYPYDEVTLLSGKVVPGFGSLDFTAAVEARAEPVDAVGTAAETVANAAAETAAETVAEDTATDLPTATNASTAEEKSSSETGTGKKTSTTAKAKLSSTKTTAKPKATTTAPPPKFTSGCLKTVSLKPYEFRAYVPKAKWVAPNPMITRFVPGHDARLNATVPLGQQEDIEISFYFSNEMNCTSVTEGITITSTTEDATTASILKGSVKCANVPRQVELDVPGNIPSIWKFSATLTGVGHGVHAITVKDVAMETGTKSTGSTDKFLFRTGAQDNPIAFPRSANYSSTLLQRRDNGTLFISHKAAGADSWRYTLDWTNYSQWYTYLGGEVNIPPKNWTGTAKQKWKGEHVIVEYYNRDSGSSDYVQHGDLDSPPRRIPNLFALGSFNGFGADSGILNTFRLDKDGWWKYDLISEWPGQLQLNQWGINPDGLPDQTAVFGDIDNDHILDRTPPPTLRLASFDLKDAPAMPYLGYRLSVNDGTLAYTILPTGNMWFQIVVFVVSTVAPVLTGLFAVWGFMGAFYSVKFNKVGVRVKGMGALVPAFIGKRFAGKQKSRALIPGSAAASRLSLVPGAAGAAADRRTILIATMEYDIEDWAIKIKIGGLGVMAQLMGKNLGHQDLIWVVPCVGGVEYPEAERAEPMSVTILGSTYEVEVQYHILRNITYVLLDAPVFRKQTKTDPYPARMDDLESAVYYSTWNQCIALAIARFPIDLYHINDYHGAAAPLYMLPDRTIPVCLSLHNAEFQGLWPLRNSKEFNEVCSVFNLPSEIVERYVQFGDVFNLLHAGASYIRLHQKGFGAVGVSAKYGARSHARYPIFWGLKKIGQLPNPDPTDLGEWSGKQDDSKVVIDEAFESARPGLKGQAQEWAGLNQDPDAELFVFVGRWSMQKGIDLIADVFPAVLESNPKVQLLTVGPVIDLYGKFAALKLDVMMKKYPGRVYSKPEFTALPPFIFSGAEFALIPSRDEPFGLVAVEFGRKGALGVGARVGGLGQMPGWWFTVESTTTAHMLSQFKGSIKEALASKLETRRKMRARSAKQRFPVAAWVEQLENLQSSAINTHVKEVERGGPRSGLSLPLPGRRSRGNSGTYSRPVSGMYSRSASMDATPTGGNSPPLHPVYFNPDNSMPSTATTSQITLNQSDFDRRRSPLDLGDDDNDLGDGRDRDSLISDPSKPVSLLSRDIPTPPEAEDGPSRDEGDGLLGNQARTRDGLGIHYQSRSRPVSMLSLNTVVGDKKDFLLQKVDPDFTDSKGEYYKAFEGKLADLSAGNSEDALCIEDYLVKSEREWYSDFKNAKLGRSSDRSRSGSRSRSRSRSRNRSNSGSSVLTKKNRGSPTPVLYDGEHEAYNMGDDDDEWLLGQDYKPPTGVRYLMQRRIGDWPVYSFVLAFGQIMAANSYQVTLLSGTASSASIVYATGAIYIIFSVIWWILFRKAASVYVLSIPFIFYGSAFFLLGLVPVANGNTVAQTWLENIATGLYAAASPSGSIFFALNFGDEGGSPIKSWVFRACVIQGTQQIYVVALWAWGNYQNNILGTGAALSDSMITTTSLKFTGIMIPIACVIWGIGALCYFGLPSYYRQAPGHVPSFYKAIMRRNIVIWFFIVIIIQNYFLSASTGRNWQYLWSSNAAKIYQIALLAIFFFIIVWALLLLLFAKLSQAHSWILPLFAIGLIAPRWAQILWATSNIGILLPWTGSPLASALVSRSLWLWLGVLDAFQGVGFGMILLQTLTRLHIAYTLVGAQIFGSVATMVARATSPNRDGQGDLFPDFSVGPLPGLSKPWFWVGLIFQLIITLGFLRFFRKEQLSKP